MHLRVLASLLALLVPCAGVHAQVPPSKAPGVASSVTLQPVAVYDAAGNIVSGFGGGSSGGASTVTGSMEQDVRSSGTLNATLVGSAIVIPVNGQSTVGLSFSGLAASGATVTYEQSNDGGTTYTGVNEVNAGTGVPAATRTTDGQTRVAVQGRTNLRLRVSTAGTGTISVAWNVSVREGLVLLASPLPPGTNAIGSVTVSNQSATGSVTAPGTAGITAQAVQGVPGGVPQNSAAGQYNATLPTLASGQTGYLATDANGRQIIAPSSTIAVSNPTAAGTVSNPGTNGTVAQAIQGIFSGIPVGVSGTLTVQPGTTTGPGGVSLASRIISSAATTNATLAKGSVGRVYKVFACNTSTTAAYIRFYNLNTAPTVGTSTVFWSRPIPPAAAAGGLACVSYDQSNIGWSFSTGIAYAVTAGAADNDTTALTAGQVVQLSVEYQ